MIVLALDLAKKSAYSVGDIEYEIEDEGIFYCKDYTEAYKTFNTLLTKWQPKICAWAVATRYFHAQRSQSRIEGVLMLAIQKYNQGKDKKDQVKIIDNIIDKSAKKVVVGKGNAKKQDVMAFFGKDDPDVADSNMFWTYIKMINE